MKELNMVFKRQCEGIGISYKDFPYDFNTDAPIPYGTIIEAMMWILKRRQDTELPVKVEKAGMNFREAVRALKADKKVRRTSWSEVNYIVVMASFGGPKGIFWSIKGEDYFVGWTPLIEDIEAEDWILMNR